MKNGGKLLIQHKVTDIKPDGPIVTVVTEGGDSFQAKRVIVTAGPWTKDLMQITGLDLPLKVNIWHYICDIGIQMLVACRSVNLIIT